MNVPAVSMNMYMRMRRFGFPVDMSMGVNSQTAFSLNPQGRGYPQHDKHYRHRDLHPQRELFRNRRTKQQDKDAHQEERDRVSKSPKRADQRRTGNALVLAHYCRHGHQMVRVERMAQTKNKPKGECRGNT